MPTPYKAPKSITIHLSGDKPVTMPNGKPLQPGDTTMPLEQYHGFGAKPDLIALIASGALRPVHVKHEFQDGDKHCIGCNMTREQAEAEKAASKPAKGKPPSETPPETPPAS